MRKPSCEMIEFRNTKLIKYNSKSRRDDTLLTVCFSIRYSIEWYKVPQGQHLKVSSLWDLLFVADSICKLKHTVNKMSSLRDLLIAVAYRKLKHTVNKMSSLRDVLLYLIYFSIR
jgi:hypothetical protein